jgi:hypothetical protein
VVDLGLDLSLTLAAYQKMMPAVEEGMVFLKGQADLASNRSRVHELAAAIKAYRDAKGAFPRGTAARAPSAERGIDWRPDQCLSWMAELLPFLPDEDARGLDPDSSWNEGRNLRFAHRLVPQFVNLNIPNPPEAYIQYPGMEGRQPVAATHFVGIAGIGRDAAEYQAGDPATAKKLGIFGYWRITRKEDVKDGLDKTIVLLQVPGDHKAPWLAGGGSTVRGVSEDADCVQEFVCLVYPGKADGTKSKFDGKRGTLAIMGDGRVRFIPEDIDPNVFRALCTIAGGETIEKLDDIAPVIEAEAAPELKVDAGPGGAPAPPPPVVPLPEPPPAPAPAAPAPAAPAPGAAAPGAAPPPAAGTPLKPATPPPPAAAGAGGKS